MKRILFLIGLIFFFAFTHSYLWGHGLNDIDWSGVFFVPLVFIIVPAVIIGFILGCIGTKRNITRMLIWTHSIGLAVVLLLNFYVLYFIIFPDNSASNAQLNEEYTRTFGDKRDSLVSLALNQLKRKPEVSKGFGILSMNTIPKDTSTENINGIHQLGFLYFVGQKYVFHKTYVTVYRFSDTSVIEIVDRRATEDDFESLDSTVRLSSKY